MNGEKGILFTQGNEACVRGALYAGLRFFAGYPITPSTEVAELLSEELPHVGGRFIQMEDEISSLCAVCAASVAGDKAMTATSGPGFSLMQEALGYAIMGEIPCVVTSVQRGGPSTGLPTKVAQGDVNQARWGVHGDHAIIVLTASSVQDVFAMTVEGFNMAETYRTPVILLFDEVVGHMRERLDMPEPGELPVVERLRTSVKAGVNYYPYLPREDGRLPMSDFGGVHRYNVTGLYHDIWGFPTEQPEAVNKLLYHLVDKIEAKAAEIATLTEQLTAAQGDAEAKAAEIATLTEQLTAAQNDAEAKAAEAAAHAEEAAKLSEELQVAKAEAAGLTDKMNTLNAELAAKKEEIVNVTALKEAAESKLSTLQEKLQPMIEAFDTLKQSIADDSLWQSILKPFTDAIDGLDEIFSK